MKIQKSELKIVLRLAVLLSAVGFYSAAQAAATVKLTVNTAGDKLVITTPGNCTTGTNNNGCVKSSGRTPVAFNLTGERGCSGTEKWKLSSVAIRKTEAGADGSGLSTLPTVGKDFNVNMTTGVLVDENGGSGNYLIQNYNSGSYTVWYRVYATCNGNKINSDPRMINDGTGSLPTA